MEEKQELTLIIDKSRMYPLLLNLLQKMSPLTKKRFPKKDIQTANTSAHTTTLIINKFFKIIKIQVRNEKSNRVKELNK